MVLERESSNFNFGTPHGTIGKTYGTETGDCGSERSESEIGSLSEALELAARFYISGRALVDEEWRALTGKLKDFATVELEPGDGRKVESVRVERKLDGSVSIFFGI